jgi:hypothetical protein
VLLAEAKAAINSESSMKSKSSIRPSVPAPAAGSASITPDICASDTASCTAVDSRDSSCPETGNSVDAEKRFAACTPSLNKELTASEGLDADTSAGALDSTEPDMGNTSAKLWLSNKSDAAISTRSEYT